MLKGFVGTGLIAVAPSTCEAQAGIGAIIPVALMRTH
jgi:hypothetical protein